MRGIDSRDGGAEGFVSGRVRGDGVRGGVEAFGVVTMTRMGPECEAAPEGELIVLLGKGVSHTRQIVSEPADVSPQVSQVSAIIGPPPGLTEHQMPPTL